MNSNKTTDRELLREILQRFVSSDVSKQDLLNLINELKTDDLPVSLFKVEGLSNLEAIVKFLRENKGLSYKEIAEKLHRNPMTLAVSYKNAKAKYSGLLVVDEAVTVPFSAFNDEFSILESVVFYFKSQGMKQVKIASLLEKDPRTIGTVIRRIKNRELKTFSEET